MSIREQRKELFATIPGWYSGTAHFTLINVATIVAICFLVSRLGEPTLATWLFVPAFFVFANGFEWWIHRGPMHHPTPGMRILYRRHTLEHHRVFTDQDMAIRSPREFFFILFPWWFLPAILVVNLPIPLILGYAISPDFGYMFYAATLAYYLVYEWFHTVHHLSPESWIGRRAFVKWVRTHHTRHHEPARMEKGNFNVSFPLWDHILGSCLGAEA